MHVLLHTGGLGLLGNNGVFTLVDGTLLVGKHCVDLNRALVVYREFVKRVGSENGCFVRCVCGTESQKKRENFHGHKYFKSVGFASSERNSARAQASSGVGGLTARKEPGAVPSSR